MSSGKQHPLHGDGLVTSLYQYLWKKDKNLESCKNVAIAETIVYEHNFPRAWFSTEGRGSSTDIKRRAGKDIDSKSVTAAFQKPAVPGLDIVAVYMKKLHSETTVQFFDAAQLRSFVFDGKERGTGILQRLVIAQDRRASVIQAVWSPRIVLVNKWVNNHEILEEKVPAYERCVTVDGPAHFSSEVFCTQQLSEKIKAACSSIVRHIQSCDHATVARMVLFFKTDANNTLYLSWCSSSRLSDQSVPLNLSPKFSPADELRRLAMGDRTPPRQTRGKGGSPSSGSSPLPPGFIPCPSCTHPFPISSKFELPFLQTVRFFVLSHENSHVSLAARRSSALADTSPMSLNSYLPMSLSPSPSPSQASTSFGGSSEYATTSPNSVAEVISFDELRFHSFSEETDQLYYEAYSFFMHRTDAFGFTAPKSWEEFGAIIEPVLQRNAITVSVNDATSEMKCVIPLRPPALSRVHRAFQEVRTAVRNYLGLQEQSPSSSAEQPFFGSTTNPATFNADDNHSAQSPVSPIQKLSHTQVSIAASAESDSALSDGPEVPALLQKYFPGKNFSDIRKLWKTGKVPLHDVSLCEDCYLLFTSRYYLTSELVSPEEKQQRPSTPLSSRRRPSSSASTRRQSVHSPSSDL